MALAADPQALAAGASTVSSASDEAADAASGLRDGARTAGGGVGAGPLGPALSRFAAAWTGELATWALGCEQLGRVAAENGRQVGAVNGAGPSGPVPR